jgi:hypothetical protein
VVMTTKEIDAKVQEIYGMAKNSATPLSVLSLQTAILLSKNDWLPAEVERVSSEVMALLIKHGWKKPNQGE